MTNDATALSPRIFTMHHTVLYVDPQTGELRGGPHGTSPANARLQCDGAEGQIVYTAEKTTRPILCLDERSRALDNKASETGTVFRIVPLDGQWVALKSQDRFLSAIPNGAVTLSPRICNAWENFVLADPRPHRSVLSGAMGRKAPSLSITCVETRDSHIARAARAVERTAGCIRPDCIYWFSNSQFPGSLPGVDVIHTEIPDFRDYIEDINSICLRLMPKVVKTDFNLIVQDHAFAVNPQAWDPLFWEYDYIGAPFCGLWGGGPYWRGPIVGNGGFSLRSRKLYDALLDLRINWRVEDWLPYDDRLTNFGYYVLNANGERCLQEDILISVWARGVLETRYGIRFCPPELAGKFSLFESHPLTQFWYGKSFGFHGENIAADYGVTLT
jgi:hypothetical protein